MIPFLFVLDAAAATDVPVWAWPATPVRYHLETEILVPRSITLLAKENLDARVGGLRLVADTECVAKPVGKNRELTCSFAYLKFTGSPSVSGEQAKVDTIMAEWTADLAGGKVELFISADGQLREFDYAGLITVNQRERGIQELQRIVLQRAFSVFDLPLPPAGDDWKRGWDQRGSSMLWGLLSLRGTMSSGVLDHKPLGGVDGLYSIDTSGRATMSVGSAVDAGATQLVDTKAAGSTQFDTTKGVMAFRSFVMDGRLTAGSHEASSDAFYYQATAIQLVDTFLPGGQAPVPISADRAPRIDNPAPAAPAGVAIVPFGDLGMARLFVPAMPEAGAILQLPTSSVLARVVVGPDGVPTVVDVYKGYAALVEPARQALMGARFPVRPQPYVVDVDVEFRQ